MAVFVLGLILMGRGQQGLEPLAGGPAISLVATVALSHPNIVTFYAASQHSDRNELPTDTLGWTKRSRSLTTAPPFFNTNSLMP